MYQNILHNFSVWIDGGGRLGDFDTIKLPKLESLKEDHIGGGMTGKVEIAFLAHDTLKAELHSITLKPDDIALFGLGPHRETEMQARGAVSGQNAREMENHVVYMRGTVDVEFEEWKPASKGGLTLPMTLSYLHYTVGDRSILRLDPMKAIWEVNGAEVHPGYSRALGY